MSKAKIIEFWKTGENPITCYRSRKEHHVNDIAKVVKEINHNIKPWRTPVIVIDNTGVSKCYDSVVIASDVTGLSLYNIYAMINGRRNNIKGFQIYKA